MHPLYVGAVDLAGHRDRIKDISILRRDVVVTHQHQAWMLGQFCAQPFAQRVQPGHLVAELLTARRLAVGEVRAHHAQISHRRGDHPCLRVVETGDVPDHIAGLATRQQGHTVVGLLAVPDAVPAGCSDFGVRKLVVGELGFLQHQHVGLVQRQPVEQLRQSNA